MTRNGKIARLPRNIRDELNQRLDNGEPAVRLVEWLNGLPEVKQILASEFEARPINEVNLSDWKNGGFLDWQAQQEALALLHEMKSKGDDFAMVSPGELVEPLTTAVMAHYAAAVYRSNTDTTEEPGTRLRRLGKSLRDLDRLRRFEHVREQIQIQREWLALEQQRTDDGQRKKFMELARDPKIINKLTPRMTEEERSQAIYDRFFPKEDSESDAPDVKPN